MNAVMKSKQSKQTERDTLIMQHAHLPYVTARRLCHKVPPGLAIEDLVSAGNFGLCRAVNSYEAGKGTQFKSWAIQLIRGEIHQALREWDIVPRLVKQQVRQQYEKSDTGSQNDISLIVFESLDIPAGTPILDEEPGPLQSVIRNQENNAIEKAIQALPERERRVVTSYYFDGESQVAIAKELSLSESRVLQLRYRALEMMSKNSQLRELFVETDF